MTGPGRPGYAPANRYPAAPLLALAPNEPHRIDVPTGDAWRLAHALGISRRLAYRYLADGLPEPAADAAAARLGLHPCLIWSEWWDLAPTDEAVENAERHQARRVYDRGRRARAARAQREEHR